MEFSLVAMWLSYILLAAWFLFHTVFANSATENFTEKIELALRDNVENYIYSPVSLYSMLAAVQAGTNKRSRSFSEIKSVIGSPSSNLVSQTPNLNLHQYIQHKYELKDSYTAFLDQMGYEGNRKIGDDESFEADAINERVAADTDGMIEKLFEKFDPDTKLVIFNTILFSEKWALPFEPEYTYNVRFLNKKVPFMFWQGEEMIKIAHNSEETDGLTYVQLEFEGGNLITFITGDIWKSTMNDEMGRSKILPKATKYVAKFSEVGLQQVAEIFQDESGKCHYFSDEQACKYEEMELDFGMPKFEFKYELKIKNILQKLGVSSMFSPRRAKLTEMFTDQNDVYVDQMIHKAAIKVDEGGAQAAAAGGLSIVPMSMPIRLLLNQPFKFIIHDKDYKTAYFVGQVRCPAGNSIADCQ